MCGRNGVAEIQRQIEVYKRFKRLIEQWVELSIDHSQTRMKQVAKTGQERQMKKPSYPAGRFAGRFLDWMGTREGLESNGGPGLPSLTPWDGATVEASERKSSGQMVNG